MPTFPLIEVDFDAAAFAADWRHCDQLANYLARTVSLDRNDPFLYANLLSTVLNEVLELAFFRHAPGTLHCVLRRDGTRDRLELSIPATEADRAFFRQGADAAAAANVVEVYTRSLLADTPPARSIGLLELAADYGAQVSLDETRDPGRITLVIEVTFADVATPSRP